MTAFQDYVKRCTVSKIFHSVRRSLRGGGSQVFNKRTGTYRITNSENIKENGHIGLPPNSAAKTVQTPSANRPQNLDIKLIQAKQQQAEMRRNR